VQWRASTCPSPSAAFLIASTAPACRTRMTSSGVVVWNQRSLRRTLHGYFAYYQRSRTRLALAEDTPEPRTVEPPEKGRVVAIPQVGGLHHRSTDVPLSCSCEIGLRNRPLDFASKRTSAIPRSSRVPDTNPFKSRCDRQHHRHCSCPREAAIGVPQRASPCADGVFGNHTSITSLPSALAA